MANEKRDPIQEQLIQARRDQILDAATQVFAEKGFQRATIRDVASTAGIADGTIYNYFANKTALILGILDRLNESERREEDFAQIGEMDLRTSVERYVRRRYATMTQDGLEIFQAVLAEVLVNPELRAVYMEQIVTPTFEVAEKYFTRLAEDGKLPLSDVPLALRAITATFIGTLVLRILGDPVLEERWDALVDWLTAMTLGGIEPQ